PHQIRPLNYRLRLLDRDTERLCQLRQRRHRPIRQPQVRPDLCANSRPFLDNDAEARACAEGDVLFGHGYFFFWVACGTRRAPPFPVPWPVPDFAPPPFGVKPYSTAGIVDILRRPFFGTSLSASFIFIFGVLGQI